MSELSLTPSARTIASDFRRHLPHIVWAAAAFGVACRLVQYAWRRSYWHDEAYLVLNVTSLPWRQLIGPLPHAQSAPPGFLVAQRAMFAMLGPSEFVMRLLPLALGCAAVMLVTILARRCLDAIGAVVAVTLFAVSDRLIWHAVEAKQYSGDVLFALLLLLAATCRGWTDTRKLLIASLLTAAGLWFSHPLVFCFGGVALALLPAFARRGMRGVSVFALCCLPALISFAALYAVSVRHQEIGALYAYWSEDLPDWSRPATLPLWLLTRPLEIGRYVYERGGEVVAAIAFVGAWRMWRDGYRQLLALLLAPMALTFAAAALHRYPFGGSRVTVFFAPAVLLLAGRGAAWIWAVAAAAPMRWRIPAHGFVVALMVFAVGQAAYHLVVPRHQGHIRPAVQFVHERREPGEPVYVVSDESPFLCYWREPGVPRRISVDDLARVMEDRFWVVAAIGNRRDQRRLDDAIARRKPVQALAYRGGAAYRFAVSK